MRLHVVDGTFELFRAHYGKRPGHTAPAGWDAKATVGVVGSMLTLLGEAAEAVTHVAAAFDNPIESFRNTLYYGYKTGDGMEPALKAQFDSVEEGVRALGITVWSMKEWEADDALATAAARWSGDAEVEQVRILTPDKDLGQMLRGRKVVQVDRIRKKEIDAESLFAARGVRPESIADWLALVGDTADGFPGLPGFGEKTAAALLARYPRLEEIPVDGKWDVAVRGADKLMATWAARREEAFLYRRLATLVTDVPLAETLADLEWKGAPRAGFTAWCQAIGATDLLARVPRWRD